MIKYNKPVNLNGRELVAELNAAGIVVNLDNSPFVDGNDDLWLDIDKKDETKAKNIVDVHNGTIVATNFAEQKTALLKRLGITADEAVLLLG
jgi:hypothetical protein